jgi:MFS family permease
VSRRELLRLRDFSLFLGSMFATGLALQMAQVAVGWQVYHIHHRPLDLGLVGLAEFIPLPLLALPAGQLADRLPRRALVAAATGLDAAVAAGLLAVTLKGAHSVWPYFGLAFLTGVASAVGAPPSRALTPSLVPREVLSAAFALRAVAFQIAAIAGPALGGVLFYVRPPLVYEVSTALSVASVVCILAMRAGREPATEGEMPGVDGVLAGVRLIRRTPVMLGAISLDLFAVLFGGAAALFPIYARDILYTGPWGLGLLRSAPAVGALAMALWLAHHPIERGAGRKMFGAIALFGAATIVFGVSRSFALSIATLIVLGAADMVNVVVRMSLVQLRTPDEMRGRVSAVNAMFIGASNQLGEFESGVTAAWFGTVPAVVLGGVGTLVVAGLWMRRFSELKELDSLSSA